MSNQAKSYAKMKNQSNTCNNQVPEQKQYDEEDLFDKMKEYDNRHR